MMKKTLSVLLATALIACVTPAYGQVSYGVANSTYSQDFNTLPTANSAWANNSTLTGWYALQSLTGGGVARSGRDTGTWIARTTINAGDGSSNAGALYSFGAAGNGERALGSVGSGTPGDFVYALVLQNTTGSTLNSFTLTYDGEQWRNGGLTDSAKQMLDFDYAVMGSAPGLTDLQGGNLSGYSMYETSVLADGSTSNDKTTGTGPLGTLGTLDFESPVSSTTGAAVNGNVAGLVSGINGTVNVSWANNAYLILRWWDNNSIGNDHGLAIDNVSFRAPEPGTIALLGLGGLTLLRRRRAA